jgi:transposase-like protein
MVGNRYTNKDKRKAYRMYRDGHTYREIAAEIGCSESTIKRLWSKEWKRGEDGVAERVNSELEKHVEQTVEVEKHHLNHLLALREQYHLISQKIIECLDEGDDRQLLSYLREQRETILASAKLEGIEPPQKNINVNANTDMTFEKLMAYLREIRDEQDERL